MEKNDKALNQNNNEEKREEGFTKPQWIGMIVGFGIAAFLFQLEQFGLIPAFLIAYGGYWIFKEIAELMLENNGESDSKEDSQPELQVSEKEDSSNNDNNNYKKWLIFAIILLAVGAMIVGFSFEGTSDSEEPVPNKKTKSESQLLESPQKKSITLGEESKVKENIRWEITDISNKGDDWLGETTNGEFISVDIQAENIATSRKEVSVWEAELVNSQGVSYESGFPSNKDDEVSYEELVIAEERTGIVLQPNIPEGFYYTFEVPKDLGNFTVELSYSLKE